MFTGIIEELGTILQIGADKITIEGQVIFADLKLGDSVAVNGVCLTASDITGHVFTAEIMPETLSRTALSALRPSNRVNLERALSASGRFGGHMVTGHIDGTGKITAIRPDSNAHWVQITAGPNILRYIIEKGSIAIDGISLTIARVDHGSFAVSIIPHTAGMTTLLSKRPGDLVNLEIDILGKYIEKLLIPGISITADFLAGHGFI